MREMIGFIVLLLACMIGRPILADYLNPAPTVTKAVEKQGYSKVKLGKLHYFFTWECSLDDTIAYEATAVNALNKRVNITVCLGITKDVTVRTSAD